MPRNLLLQVLKGSFANMPVLGDGEFYFATDTTTLYVGFGGLQYKLGVGMAQVQIQDSAGNALTSTASALDVNIKSSTGDNPLPVSAASLPLPAGAATDASLTNGNQKTQVVGIVATTQQGGASGLLGDTQAKGIQGTVALMVQDFKDSGRVIKVLSAAFTPATTEAMLTLTPIIDGVAGTPATSFTVTAGKRFRILHLAVSKENTTAAVSGVTVNLRMTASGAVVVTSPLIATTAAGTGSATIGISGSGNCAIPDGIEFSGTMQCGVSAVGTALAGCFVTVIGYEY